MSTLRPVNGSPTPLVPPPAPRPGPVDRVDLAQLLTGEGPLTLPPRWTSSPSFLPGAVPGAEGTIVAGSREGEVVALTAVDGSERWRKSVGELAGSPVSGEPGETVACTKDGRLVCVGADGGVRWERTVAKSLAEPPLPAPGGRLLVRTPDGSLLSCRARDGAEIWSQKVGGGFERSPRPAVDADGTVYVITFRPTHMHALDADTGRPRWSVGVNETPNSLAAADGRVYMGYTGGLVSAYETSGGGFLWHGGHDVQSSVRVAAEGGVVYGATDAGRIFALEGESGRGRWSRELGGRLSAPVRAAEGLIVADPTGRVHQVDGATGAVRWQSAAGAEPPLGARATEPCATAGAVVTADAQGRLRGVDPQATFQDLVERPASVAGPEIRQDEAAVTIGGISLPIRPL